MKLLQVALQFVETLSGLKEEARIVMPQARHVIRQEIPHEPVIWTEFPDEHLWIVEGDVFQSEARDSLLGPAGAPCFSAGAIARAISL